MIVVNLLILKHKLIYNMAVTTHEFKLFDFNVKDEHSDDDDDDFNSKFIIQMFGINEKGEQAAIRVEKFAPFFYVKVGDLWKQSTKNLFFEQIKKRIGSDASEKIIDCRLIERKKLYGFDSGKMYRFIFFKFEDMATFHTVKKLWYSYKPTADGGNERVLTEGGYPFNGCATTIYESFIPPLLRLFHMKNVSPSGWISVDEKNITHMVPQKTTCTYEFSINFNDIVSLPEKETAVPYKIMSFDIEASSSHGDFPVPIKSYKKLASDILDYFDKFISRIDDDYSIDTLLRYIIYHAFGFKCENKHVNDDDDLKLKISQYINIVYPKFPIASVEELDVLIDSWLSRSPESTNKGDSQIVADTYRIDQMFSDAKKSFANSDEDVTENIDEDTNFKDKNSKTKPIYSTVSKLVSSNSIEREDKMNELVISLGSIFPKLEGDKITFIGSTFLTYGTEIPYLNHCIALDTCDNISTENSQIESYSTEQEVLLAWQRLVQREDPDIIIGYNIFGFDYEFMFRRSQECRCTSEFLQLSRIKNQICGTLNPRTDAIEIEHATMVFASNAFEFSYINPSGRLQIDLLYWFRRGENWDSYKLDYASSKLIGDVVTKIDGIFDEAKNEYTRIYTNNMSGLYVNSFIHFNEINYSSNYYKDGQKFKVLNIDRDNGWFEIGNHERPCAKTIRWGLAKDDVTPQDIFRMTNEGPASRAVIAKYCIQDCNLVHQLFKKVDVVTDLSEMSRLCSVPMSFLVFRGQGIKLTSFVAKKCREKGFLMPDINKGSKDDGYEGAIVLEPKTGFYTYDEPVPVGDFSSLYPSCMLSENLCPSSKVWSKVFDLNGKLLSETGVRSGDGTYTYDNLDGYSYVDVTFDTFKYVRKTPKAKAEKIKSGYKICRFAKYGENRAIMPSILDELLKARKNTRKMIPQQSDDFMKNVLDKRQLAYKVTANSLYGQLGAKTSTFYEPDIAASTTATGRLLLTYAQRIVVECYNNTLVSTTQGDMMVTAEYIYGDTDSVFFKFVIKDAHTQEVITGKKCLELSIEISKKACNLVSKFLKQPHDFEYEKTFAPFCLLSKKRYVGMLYEDDPNKGKRKEMGIVLKRRDNAPIVKDVYGGVIDILMSTDGGNVISKSIDFINEMMNKLVAGKVQMEKLIISKSLRSFYKAPKQQCHKVLADRIGLRDPGNKPAPGDRIPYIYIVNNNKLNNDGSKVLQGDKIESPSFIRENNIPIDYAHYITNQIMKPLQQLFGLVLVDIWKMSGKTIKIKKFIREKEQISKEFELDHKKREEKIAKITGKEIKAIIFDKYLRDISNMRAGNRNITTFFAASRQ